MKRVNYKRKFISYIAILSVFLSSFLLYTPSDSVLSAPGEPFIEVLTPIEGSVLTDEMVVFTGSFFNESTPSNQLQISVFEKIDSSSELIEITSDGKITESVNGQNNIWTFSKLFTEGSHSISFFLESVEGKIAEKTINFTVNKNKVDEQNTNKAEAPVIVNEPAVSQAEVLPAEEDLNEAAEEVVEEKGPRPFIVNMKIIPNGITDENKYLPIQDMTQVPLDSKIMMVIREAGLLTYSQPLIISSTNGEIVSKEDIEGIGPQRNEDGDYVITFTPSKQLDPSTTYYVYVNPSITNDLGNRIFPRVVKFTTANINHLGDIHGNYANNTNSCAYCHSTHNGKNPTLEGGSFGSEAGNYCMACHDGTNGSPMPDNYNTDNKHAQHTDGKLKGAESCTGCHNPHASWTKENPARLQSTQVAGASHFQTYVYKKAGTTTGEAEDFSLCFSCHDGSKAIDIKQYYTGETQVADSGHNITAADGSALDGQLACADCHETHGSDNIMLLREELGNVKLADADKFKTTGAKWNASNERQFCLKCHNNTTEIYGKTGIYKEKNDAEEPILGHQNEDTQSCSSCHGGASQSAIEAAHSPKNAAK